jgi:SAM-dependent methyltransferase
MAKKTKDVELDYLAQLGITPAKDMGEVRGRLVTALGEENAKALWRALHRQKPGGVTLEELYAWTDKGLEDSLKLADAMDGDALRKMCRWVAYHKKQLGKTVLDVGCGNGVLTCFVAMQLPQAQVVGVDLRPQAVEQGTALAQRLGLSNVTFRQGGLEQRNGEQFDTILLSRVVRENVGANLDAMSLLNTQAERMVQGIRPFVEGCKAALNPGGKLVSFEQFSRGGETLGWLYALCQGGFSVEEKYQKELLIQGADSEKTALSITVATEGQSVDRAQIWAMFTRLYAPDARENKYVMMGAEAEVYLQAHLGELIRGYQAYFDTGDKACRMTLWTDKEDPNTLLNEQQAAGSKSQLFLSIPEKREAEIEAMEKDVHNFRRRGLVVKELRYENGVETETDCEL